MTETSATRTEAGFTPESANRALPYVRAVVDDVVEAFERLRKAETTRARAMAGNPSAGSTPADREKALRDAEEERRAAREDLTRVGRELEKVGVELKDPETGLVDFPSEMQGRRVYLCWKRGEASVAWWHEMEGGFRGRRPLPDSDPGSPPGRGGADPGPDDDDDPAG